MKKVLWLTAGLVLIGSGAAFADVAQIKIYKEAFPDAKIKCLFCHVDAIPKKDAGKHELNAYGQKVLQECPKPTAETYKKVGSAETQASEK